MNDNTLINLDFFTVEKISHITEDNYEDNLVKIFPGSRSKHLPCGMRILEGGGPQKLVFILGFQACILSVTLLINSIMERLDTDKGYLIFDWPGIGQNKQINSHANTNEILYSTLSDILTQYDVLALVPTSLGCRLVFSRLKDLSEYNKKLRIMFVVPAILSMPDDNLLTHYFSFFLMLYTRFGIQCYRAVNSSRVVRWVWNKIICQGKKVHDPRILPILNLEKRMSVTLWTPKHFLDMSKCDIPQLAIIPDNVVATVIFAKSDQLAQPKEHQMWFYTGNIPEQSIYWVDSNHLAVIETPEQVAQIIVQALNNKADI